MDEQKQAECAAQTAAAEHPEKEVRPPHTKKQGANKKKNSHKKVPSQQNAFTVDQTIPANQKSEPQFNPEVLDAELEQLRSITESGFAAQAEMLQKLAASAEALKTVREQECVKALETEIRMLRSNQAEHHKLYELQEQKLAESYQRLNDLAKESGALKIQIQTLQSESAAAKTENAELAERCNELEKSLLSASAMHQNDAQQMLLDYQSKLKRALSMSYEDFEEYRDSEMNEDNFATVVTILRSVFRALASNGIQF